MKPAPFEYSRPASIDEACALLAAEDGARLIAGGQTLVPLMAMRLARPTRLIDIARIPALAYVRDAGEVVEIGATTRQCELERDPVIAAKVPMLAAVMPWVGHAATRARGTIGGSLANADPAAEIALVAVTLGATLVYRDGAGTREVAAAEFFVGPMTTVLPASGCLTAVRFPVWPDPSPARGGWPAERSEAGRVGSLSTPPPPGSLRSPPSSRSRMFPTSAGYFSDRTREHPSSVASGGGKGGIGVGFHEVSTRRSDFAFVAAVAQVALDADGTCRRLAVGVGAATACPLRLDTVAAALMGTRIENKAVRAAVGAALADIEPLTDLHASGTYRRRVAATLAVRAIADASKRAANAH